MGENLIINPYIHKEANLKKEVFLERIKNVQYLKKEEKLLVSDMFLPENAKEWNYLEKLYNAVNKGYLSLVVGKSKAFTIDLGEELTTWFANNTLRTIQKQVINCIASTYFNSNSTKKRYLDDYIYSPVLEKAKAVIERYYPKKSESNVVSRYLETKRVWLNDKGNQEKYEKYLTLREKFQAKINESEPEEIYKKASMSYIGCPPPNFLPPIIKEEEELIFFEYGYFSESDWNRIVQPILKNEKIISQENLERYEGDKDLFQKWYYAYTNFEETKQHFYLLFENENAKKINGKGFVYLVRHGNSSKVKVGWTRTEKGVEGRLRSMQTGNPELLTILSYFRVSSSKTEKMIHFYFEKKRIRGEWFELSEEDCENILSDDWRVDNNIF